ncbi:MAG: DNA mismatch repair endonuclease MutL [Gammaproteobacteria bacterium]|nr:DNA mismatch repair endonuclease MutL [Gammaproteobacteria bacterium]
MRPSVLNQSNIKMIGQWRRNKVQTRILQLSPLIANQIAAGEVVERPASVVKELLENSIDAKATKIEVEIEGGGMHLIRVRDNGHGIIKPDLELAFSRHATSKIRTQADLEAIHSMGFRGEALASIASISRCRLLSQSENQEGAWQIQFAPDLTSIINPTAHPQGTTVEVADLFYNTPVRRKFLRSEKTEFQAIDDMFKRQALAHPEITFSLKHQQRQVRFYPKISNQSGEKTRIGKICGQQFINQAVEVSMQAGSLYLRGWLGYPQLARRQADCQYFFVNQRMIKDRLINHVIKTIYQQHALMVEGSYPCYVLFLNVDPGDVDVNVHPTKQEVRFSQARLVHDFLSKCVRDSLNQINDEPAQATPYHQTPALSKRFSSEFYQIAKENPVEIKQQTINHGKRFAFIEDEDDVILVSLLKAKPSLLAFYFKNYAGSIATKTLLFPKRFTKPQCNMPSSQCEAILKNYGLIVRVQDQDILLLEQPNILQGEITQAQLDKMMTIDSLMDHAVAELTVNWSCLGGADFTSLLQAWMNHHPQGPWVRISHQQFEEMIFQKEATIALEL